LSVLLYQTDPYTCRLTATYTAVTCARDHTGAARATRRGLTTATHCRLDYCNATTCSLSRQLTRTASERRYRGSRSGDKFLPGLYVERSGSSGKDVFWFFHVTGLTALCTRYLLHQYLQLFCYTVWVKKSPSFSGIFPKRLGIFSPNFTRLLHVPTYAGLQIFILLSATMTKLCYENGDADVIRPHDVSAARSY